MSFVLPFLVATNSVSADVIVSPGKSLPNGGTKVPAITITGMIADTDVSRFLKAIEEAESDAHALGVKSKPYFIVFLDSPGGSVKAAMAIGREIRKSRPLSVTVPENGRCVSSCVLILAGGASRAVYGRVGIHRPFLQEDINYSPEDQKKTYSTLEKVIKDYLNEMNVPTALYDTMFRIPPEKVRFLSAAELQNYNLSEDDPYFKEADDAAIAKGFGLSKAQYVQYKAEINRLCQSAPSAAEFHNCSERVLKKFTAKHLK